MEGQRGKSTLNPIAGTIYLNERGKDMKRTIKVEGVDGNVITGEVNIPNKQHLEVQKNTRVQVFKSKKAYTRKSKYQRKGWED